LLDLHILSKQDLEVIAERVEQEVDESVQFAEDSPFPPAESLHDYVYAPDEPAHERR
jgi:TPP-dependent pyruvate/acetoin dehydrogenase alpha subunit